MDIIIKGFIMAAVKIKWSSLLNLKDLEFTPDAPKVLMLSDELLQSLSWLTAATREDRRFIRCTDNGALLVADAWAGLNAVENDELYPESTSEKTTTFTVANKGVLIASSTQIIQAKFVRVSGGSSEDVTIPPSSYYWFAHECYSVTVHTVPDPGGTASYVGVTAFD